MPLNYLTPANLSEVAHFLASLNSLPEHNICYIGITEDEITAELSVVLPPEGYGCLSLDEAGQVNGFLGFELDPSMGRGWLFGPFVDAYDWQALADQLYQAGLQSLPQEIDDLELCGGNENTRLEAFAARYGFTPGTEAALLNLPRPAEPAFRLSGQANTATLDSQDQIAPYLPSLAALHEALFPNTYYAADQLLAMSADAGKRLQIELENGDLAGYIFLQARPANQDAHIDFLGVPEEYRRHGIAGKLLADSLGWAFAHPFVEQATLTVHTSNTTAIRLYERAGFHIEQLMRGYRKRNK